MSMLTRNKFAAILLVLCVSGVMTHAIEIDAAALYRFEEQAETIAVGEFLTDASGKERHAEAFGGVIGLVAGKAGLGQAGFFDQSSAFADFEDVDTSGDFTFALWMKSATLGQADVYLLSLSNGSGGGEQTAVIYQYEQNTVELYSGNSATNLRPGSQLSVPDTEWHHIVYTRSGSDYDAYLDGAKHDIATVDGPVHNPQYLSIGGTGHLRDTGPLALYEGLLDDVLVMTRGIDQAEVDFIMRGFTHEFAAAPSPENDAADVLRDHVLTWEPGEFAATHDLYVGESFVDVNNATIPTLSDLDVNSFDAGRFEFGQTYYWRVDEVNGTADKTVFKGGVWRFTVEPYSIPIPGADIIATASSSSNDFSTPQKTLDGSGLGENGTHDIQTETMWFTATGDLEPWIQYEFDGIKKLDTMTVWNSNSSAEGFIGYGVKDVKIEYSEDGQTWNIFEDANEFSRAPGVPTYNQYDEINLGGLAAKMVRLNIQSNFGGFMQSYSLSEVQFSMIPTAVRTPVPDSGSVDISPNAVLSWRAGRESAQSTVYLSTDANEVADGIAASLISNTNSINLSPFDVELGQTYYWRVDEVNETEVPSVWAGPVWSFSIVDAIVVENFESYNNNSPLRPFQVWLDGFGYSADEFFPAGYGGNGTGAGVGHDIWSVASAHYNGNIMETGVTLTGSSRSMPFYYTNTGGAASQTERQFATPQNWTTSGIKTLSVSFYDVADNTGELYVKINSTKVPYDGDPDNIVFNVWQTWHIDLTALQGMDNVTSLAIGVDGAGAAGVLYIDDIRLSPQAAVNDVYGDDIAINLYEWAPEGFLDNTPTLPDYWGSDLDATKLTDGVIAADYSGGLCAGWNFSSADAPFGPTLYFDLGSIQSIGGVAIYHQPKYYGFETVTVSVSSRDNPNRVDITDMVDWTGQEIHGSDHWGAGDSGNAPSVMQAVPIGQEGRWVRLQFLNWTPGYDTSWTMFSEFKFYAE